MILFAKATPEQIEVIKNCLHLFCEALGKKVRVVKKIFFSKNVYRDTAMKFIELMVLKKPLT